MKPKLLLIVPNLHQGGQQKVCLETAKILKDDFEIKVVIFEAGNEIYSINGIEVIFLNIPSSCHKLYKIWHLLKRINALRNIEKSFKPDISYSFGMTANLVNLASLSTVKKIIGIRGFIDWKDSKILPLMVRKADLCICCSQELCEYIKTITVNDRVIGIYNPIDIDAIRDSAEENFKSNQFIAEEKVISFVGRINDVKGLWHLIKSIKLLRDYGIICRLLIIGDGDCEEYKELAKNLGVLDCIEFLGPQRNPFKYLKDTDVFVLPSVSEGFPNALLEAMALGIPVISSNCVSGPAEILSDNWMDSRKSDAVIWGKYGVLYPVKNICKNLESNVIESEEKLIAECIITLLSDEKIYENYKAAGIIRSKAFTIERYKESLVRAFLG